MDRDAMRLLAHVDQSRAELRQVVRDMTSSDLAALIKACAAGELAELEPEAAQLAGLLAALAIFDLREWREG